MEWWNLTIFKGLRTQTTNCRNIFCQDGYGVMKVGFFFKKKSTDFLGFRTHVVAITVCTTGVYIHSPVARTFFCAQRAHCVLRTLLMRITHTHGSSVCKKVFACVSYLSISPSLSHVSPVFCRLRTTLSLSRLSRPHVLAVFTCPKSAGHAHLRTRTRSLAIWPSPPSTQVVSPNEFDKITSVANDTMLINDLNHNFSDFAKTHTREHWIVQCSHSVWILHVSHVSHDDFVLPNGKQRKHAIGKPLLDRERKETEGFVICAAESMSKKG